MPFSLGRIGMRSPFAMSIAPEAFYEATLGLPKSYATAISAFDCAVSCDRPRRRAAAADLPNPATYLLGRLSRRGLAALPFTLEVVEE
jgi:hypothetical protein